MYVFSCSTDFLWDKITPTICAETANTVSDIKQAALRDSLIVIFYLDGMLQVYSKKYTHCWI